MILTACIQGNLTVDEVKEYAKLKAKNDELKRKIKPYKQAIEEIKNLLYTAENTTNGDLYFELVSKAYMKCNEVLDD